MNNVADMCTRLRNAMRSDLLTVDVLYSKFIFNILDVIKSRGYISDVKYIDNRLIEVRLKYTNNGCVLSGISPVSKSSRRMYISYNRLKISYKLMHVLSTSKGVMSGRDAIKNKVGGEVLCTVW